MLRGAAVEPEVTDLARFLQGAGADITGVGTRVLHIRGRELLMGCLLYTSLTAYCRPGDAVLVKASHGMAFETILDGFYKAVPRD